MSGGETTRLFKFYSTGHVLENLNKRRLKIATLFDLNDPFEFNSYSLSSASQRKIWNNALTKIGQTTGVICFCRSWSNPVIWSHYAESHKGLALGFDVNSDLTMSVNYRKSRPTLPSFESTDSNKLLSMVQKSFATKFDHWKYEDEVRMFAEIDDLESETGLLFKDFDQDLRLREVIIGAKSTIRSSDISEALQGISNVKIRTARTAFKTFRIVEQLNKNLQK